MGIRRLSQSNSVSALRGPTGIMRQVIKKGGHEHTCCHGMNCRVLTVRKESLACHENVKRWDDCRNLFSIRVECVHKCWLRLILIYLYTFEDRWMAFFYKFW